MCIRDRILRNIAASQAARQDTNFGFGLDTTIAFDVPGAQGHEKITELGKGAAIKIMDSQTICDYRMVNYMKEISKKKKLTTNKVEVLTQ